MRKSILQNQHNADTANISAVRSCTPLYLGYTILVHVFHALCLTAHALDSYRGSQSRAAAGEV